MSLHLISVFCIICSSGRETGDHVLRLITEYLKLVIYYHGLTKFLYDFFRVKKANISYKGPGQMPRESEIRDLKIFVGKQVLNLKHAFDCKT